VSYYLKGLPRFAIASRGRLWTGSSSYAFLHNPVCLDVQSSKPPMSKMAFPILDDTLDLTLKVRQAVQTAGNMFTKFKGHEERHVHTAW